MLTAAEARELRPRVHLIDRVRDDVERAIRNVAIAGRREAEISALIPNFTAWASGKGTGAAAEALDAFEAELVENGYSVEKYEGGSKGRPSFRVSWNG